MSNKTFIPAFQCKVGDWKYYISMMKYGEVARQVSFAHELSSNSELGQLVQRGLSARTKDITEYLLTSPARFLGALVVAAWGGEPTYTSITMDDPDGMLRGLDRGFGVLTFDGTQAYFALDGQHRLRAIKDAVRRDPSLGGEDICVLIVTHYDTAEGRTRTRRLFTNINRNAVKTAKAEDIVLDEDDAFAVLARRLLDDHKLLREDGRVKVITRTGDDGELRLAGNSLPKSDPKALTTLPVLYDLIQYLGWDFASAVRQRKVRPSVSELDKCYEKLADRVDQLLSACGNVSGALQGGAAARDLRSPRGKEGEGHPMMRPVVQKAVARVAKEICEQGHLQWNEVLKRLSKLDWRLAAAPWCAVYNGEAAKMMVGKENTELLAKLLHAHLAPASMQSIKGARREFKAIRGVNYPVPEEKLAKGLAGVAQGQRGVTPSAVAELSDRVEDERRHEDAELGRE